VSRPFSSTLGVPEALAVRRAGLRPLRQVLGVSYYNVGWQQMPWNTGRGWGMQGRSGETFELETQSEVWNLARRQAIDRLREEAVACDADAVVGVRIERSHRDWARGLVEFTAVGTAVRCERVDLGDVAERPLLCNLSGEDVLKLVTHGFWPVGIVGGSTVAYGATGSRQRWSAGRMFAPNQELPDFTRAMYDARALAMAHVERDAHALHAHGVVGVTIDRSIREREVDVNSTSYTDLIITMHILGTAIVEVRHDDAPPPKYLALPLR